MKIFIFVRQGCCLCDSLKNKLAKISYESSLNDQLVLFDIAENIYKVKLEKN